MKTLIYCEGLSIDEPEYVCTLPGCLQENKDEIKKKYRAAYCEKGDRVRFNSSFFPGGAKFKSYTVRSIYSFSTSKSDYSYFAFHLY